MRPGRRLYPLFFICLFCIGIKSNAQLIINNGATPQQLVQNLLGAGVSVSNISYTGASVARAIFIGTNSNIGLSGGVLLTSGSAANAIGPNNSGSSGTNSALPGYPILDSISGVTTFDAAILEFDFVPMADTIRFRYVFASEEYNEFVCGTVNDAFGFFISGPGISGQKNLAIIPGTNIPVSINTLNNGSCGANGSFHTGCDLGHAAYFVTNNAQSVQYDGFTVVLTAQTVVTPCLTYHIRLAIADGGDGAYDSGVFLEAGSFSGTNPIVATALPTSGILANAQVVGCAPFVATFSNTSTGTNHFAWNFGDGSSLDTTANPIHTYAQGGTYLVHLYAMDTTVCNYSDTASFTLVLDSGVVIPAFNLVKTGICDSLNAVVTTASTGNYLTYGWNFGDGTFAAGPSAIHMYTAPGTYTIYHIVTDTTCNISDSVFQSLTLLPRLRASVAASDLAGCIPLSIYVCDIDSALSASSSFLWDFGNGNTSRSSCDSAFFLQSGNYSVKLVVSDTTSCNQADSSDITITAKIKPEAAFSLPDSQNVFYALNLTNTSIDGFTYNWNFDDGQFAFVENPVHQFTQPGIYNICLTTYRDACFDTTCHTLIAFESPQEIWFPAGFSPNGDGKNDLFSAVGVGVVTFQMVIFNRWGQEVYESNSITNGWDGTFNGRAADNGLYVFHIKATLENKEEYDRYGTVTLYK